MANRDVRIDSYFSLPTDLASELREWPEFVAGEDYSVELQSSSERVLVRPEFDEEQMFIRLTGSGSGPLFHRVLGVAIHALSAHSDSVFITRWSS
jgi:hypothetical protein